VNLLFFSYHRSLKSDAAFLKAAIEFELCETIHRLVG